MVTVISLQHSLRAQVVKMNFKLAEHTNPCVRYVKQLYYYIKFFLYILAHPIIVQQTDHIHIFPKKRLKYQSYLDVWFIQILVAKSKRRKTVN